jgi:hypothetical protein
MNKKVILVCVFILCVLFFASCGAGDRGPAGPAGPDGGNLSVMNFQDGVYPSTAYAGTSDSYINAGAGADINYGGADTMYLGFDGASGGAERCVIKFDLSPLDSQPVTVKYAYITLYISQQTSFNNLNTTAHKLISAWDEGGITWNDGSSGVPWTAAGGDYGAAAAGSSVLLDSKFVYVTFTLDAGMVQSWVTDPGRNYGVILISDIENSGFFGFFTKDYSITPAQRPRLTVYYEVE